MTTLGLTLYFRAKDARTRFHIAFGYFKPGIGGEVEAFLRERGDQALPSEPTAIFRVLNKSRSDVLITDARLELAPGHQARPFSNFGVRPPVQIPPGSPGVFCCFMRAIVEELAKVGAQIGTVRGTFTIRDGSGRLHRKGFVIPLVEEWLKGREPDDPPRPG